ncbi:FadR/GntR family transcriptional regulator [Oerskovia flava]|uniref:FadR/GntR family transcriptional regulator n=1 Tax=Oerskovia flava TaxID=2986422 RepID=UPI00223FAE39|nr:FadR/GntR family transcriptional regulator [Oerskovia sp. JB1-3-2]
MSRTDDVVAGIKRMIIDGDLSAGDRLPVEKDLAEALGVSRGSLREGVRALSILGIVDTRQGDGTYVTSLDPARLLAPMGFVVELQGDGSAQPFHAVRRILETEAAALAATRITDDALAEARALLDGVAGTLEGGAADDHEQFIEVDIAFHRIIARHSGNPVLAALVESLASRTVRERLWRGLHEEGVEGRTHQEHVDILTALSSRDPEAARIRMANHLLGVEQSLRSVPVDDEQT